MMTPAPKSAGKDINKSEEIRKAAKVLKEQGEKPRPVVIIAALKKQGITVSSPQVSMVLKRMGFKPRKRRSSEEIAMHGTGRRGTAVSVDDLIKAKKMVKAFGSADRAIAAVEALKRLGN
jgi:pyridoxal/pyridoxine/pyridoxamine kinase